MGQSLSEAHRGQGGGYFGSTPPPLPNTPFGVLNSGVGGRNRGVEARDCAVEVLERHLEVRNRQAAAWNNRFGAFFVETGVLGCDAAVRAVGVGVEGEAVLIWNTHAPPEIPVEIRA